MHSSDAAQRRAAAVAYGNRAVARQRAVSRDARRAALDCEEHAQNVVDDFDGLDAEWEYGAGNRLQRKQPSATLLCREKERVIAGHERDRRDAARAAARSNRALHEYLVWREGFERSEHQQEPQRLEQAEREAVAAAAAAAAATAAAAAAATAAAAARRARAAELAAALQVRAAPQPAHQPALVAALDGLDAARAAQSAQQPANIRPTNAAPSGTDCSVCLSALNSGDCCVTLCNHFFHASCIAVWLRSNQTCPNCRAGL
jgi:hypothetical protein